MKRKQDQISFAASDFRRGVYERVLTKIRLVVITRMARPEEVLILEDENGERSCFVEPKAVVAAAFGFVYLAAVVCG